LEIRKRFLPLHSRNEGKKKGGNAEGLKKGKREKVNSG
jgi:hypothetical protein